MDITVVARNVEIHLNLCAHVEERVSKVTQFYPCVQRVDVEPTHERNPRQADIAECTELTVYGRGPIIRAEVESVDRYTAIDIAAGKPFECPCRMRDRAKDHRRRYPRELDEVEVIEEVALAEEMPVPETPAHLRSAEDPKVGKVREEQLGDSSTIVRQEVRGAAPTTVDEALGRMGVVGHPFFLFVDKDTKQPCVVYYRRGWVYGAFRLNTVIEQDGVSLHHINETRAPASSYAGARARRAVPVDTNEFVRRGPRGRVVLVGTSKLVWSASSALVHKSSDMPRSLEETPGHHLNPPTCVRLVSDLGSGPEMSGRACGIFERFGEV